MRQTASKRDISYLLAHSLNDCHSWELNPGLPGFSLFPPRMSRKPGTGSNSSSPRRMDPNRAVKTFSYYHSLCVCRKLGQRGRGTAAQTLHCGALLTERWLNPLCYNASPASSVSDKAIERFYVTDIFHDLFWLWYLWIYLSMSPGHSCVYYSKHQLRGFCPAARGDLLGLGAAIICTPQPPSTPETQSPFGTEMTFSQCCRLSPRPQ